MKSVASLLMEMSELEDSNIVEIPSMPYHLATKSFTDSAHVNYKISPLSSIALSVKASQFFYYFKSSSLLVISLTL